MSGECPEGQWAPLDYCTPMPPEMIERNTRLEKERLEMNLECSQQTGQDLNPKCFKMCVDQKNLVSGKWGGLPQGSPQQTKQLNLLKQQMEILGCDKHRTRSALGGNEMKEALPWMIGVAVVLVLIYKIK